MGRGGLRQRQVWLACAPARVRVGGAWLVHRARGAQPGALLRRWLELQGVSAIGYSCRRACKGKSARVSMCGRPHWGRQRASRAISQISQVDVAKTRVGLSPHVAGRPAGTRRHVARRVPPPLRAVTVIGVSPGFHAHTLSLKTCFCVGLGATLARPSHLLPCSTRHLLLLQRLCTTRSSARPPASTVQKTRASER